MERISDEQKASEMLQLSEFPNNRKQCDAVFQLLMQMAGWEKQQMIDKAAEWVEKYLFEIGYPDDWLRDSPNIRNGKTRFLQAMKGEQ